MDTDTPVAAAAAVGVTIEAIKQEVGTLKREISHKVEGAVQGENEEAERAVKKIKVESTNNDLMVKQEDGRKKGVAPVKAEYAHFTSLGES